MRMWKVVPKCLCRQHLLGEHYELHKFVGAINKGHNLRGYIEGGLMEVHNIESRHQELVREMEKRGMNHKSPLPVFVSRKEGKVDINRSKKDLINRCEECRRRFHEIQS